MIIEKKFLNKLKDFGLNSYEAKLWAALLSRGVSSASELSEISNVPRSRTYDVLESLEKKGFVVMKLDKPMKYMAVPPLEVIERVKKQTLEEAEKQVAMIESLKDSDVIKELQLLHSQGMEVINPEELSAYLKSRYHYYNQLDSMIKNATETVFLITTEEGLIRKAEQLKRAFSKASKRNVKIKILAPITEKNKDAAAKLKKFATIRNLKKKELTMRMCIVDNQEVIFSLLHDKTDERYDGAIWTKSAFFAQGLLTLFQQIWKEAEEIKVTV